MKVFMLRDMSTGLYSKGGYLATFVPFERAKQWTKFGYVRSHLNVLFRYGKFRGDELMKLKLEIVEVDVQYTIVSALPANAFIKARK